MTPQSSVPSYAELQIQNEEEYQKKMSAKDKNLSETECITKFLELVNYPVPEVWLKTSKVGGNRTIKYIPIDKVEFLLTRLFSVYWRREILREHIFLNTVVSTVRLHYKIPGTQIWCYHDAAGGDPIKVNKDAAASDLSQIQTKAIQTGFPSSVSYALSNAAALIGRLFGAGLNKDNVENYEGFYDPNKEEEQTTPPPAQTAQVSQPAQITQMPQQQSSGITVQMPTQPLVQGELKMPDNSTKENSQTKKSEFTLKF